MTIFEGVQALSGRPAVIHDVLRSDLPNFFEKMGYNKGAEVGVYKGEYSELFCKKGFEFYAIDPWKAFYGQGRTQQYQERQDFLYEHTKRTLQKYPNCTIIRKSSMGALEDFDDESLDFVYIDGDHTFTPVVNDLHEWSKKIRKGGCVAGHDYFNSYATRMAVHVKTAVDSFTRSYQIENFYIFGQNERTGDKDDKFYSFLWIKQ